MQTVNALTKINSFYENLTIKSYTHKLNFNNSTVEVFENVATLLYSRNKTHFIATTENVFYKVSFLTETLTITVRKLYKLI